MLSESLLEDLAEAEGADFVVNANTSGSWRKFICRKSVYESSEQFFVRYQFKAPAGGYKRLTNSFEVVICKQSQTATFGPKGSISVSKKYRGYGLGSYFMSLLILQLHSKYPDVAINSGCLSPVDGADIVNRIRRNTFYEHLGFTVESDEYGSGTFKANSASDLKTNFNEGKVNTACIAKLVMELDEIEFVRNRLESTLLERSHYYQNGAQSFHTLKVSLLLGLTGFLLGYGLHWFIE